MAQADRQLPIGEEIFLDHVGHFVRDREAAARALARAGFAPTPVSIQANPDPQDGAPRLTGTGNVTAMLARGYVEVLFKTADTPLGRELDAALARHPGVHLAAFAVADAASAHRRLGASGFRVRPLVEMQRPVDLEHDQAARTSPPPCGEGLGVGVTSYARSTPSGTTPLPNPPPPPGRLRPSSTGYGGRESAADAAFTIARLEAGEMPEGRIQILTHRTEHLVWQRRWLTHPNGALGLASVIIAVSHVDEAAERFARFTGRSPKRTSFGRSIELDRGRVDLMTAGACAGMLPEVALPSLPFVAAYELTVRSLDAMEPILAAGGLPMRRRGESIVAAFPEALGHGAWIFSPASASGADPK
jgi:hypothetical protein